MTNDPFDLAQKSPPQQLTVFQIAMGVCIGNLLSIVFAFSLTFLLALVLAWFGRSLPDILK